MTKLNMDMPLFDHDESDLRKRRGMELARGPRKELLSHAKRVAREIAMGRMTRTCTADDVQEHLHEVYGLTPGDLGPAAGSLFKGKDWEFTGDRVRSTNVKNHGRELKVWRYVEEA